MSNDDLSGKLSEVDERASGAAGAASVAVNVLPPARSLVPSTSGALRLAGRPQDLSDPRYWARRITSGWRNALEAIFDTGRDLIAAKEALPHGAFGVMVEHALPFGGRTARRLMAIAKDERLAKRTRESILPASPTILYELTRLDDRTLANAFASRRISPEMDRASAQMLAQRSRRKARLAEIEARAARQPTLAERDRRYVVVYADPPWHQETWSENGRGRTADRHYPTMTFEQLKSLPVAQIAATNSVLFMWSTVPHLAQAIDLMRAWGFTYKSHCMWSKRELGHDIRFGTGYWFRGGHEVLLVGTRGKIPAPLPGARRGSVVETRTVLHSQKPAEFRYMIEEFFPGVSRIELFQRGKAPRGWDVWGYEAGSPLPDTGC